MAELSWMSGVYNLFVHGGKDGTIFTNVLSREFSFDQSLYHVYFTKDNKLMGISYETLYGVKGDILLQPDENNYFIKDIVIKKSPLIQKLNLFVTYFQVFQITGTVGPCFPPILSSLNAAKTFQAELSSINTRTLFYNQVFPSLFMEHSKINYF